MLPYALVAVAVAWAIWKLLRPFLLRSPLGVVPGPGRKSLVSGNLEQLFDRDAWGFHDELAQQYGPIVKLNAVLGVSSSLHYLLSAC